MSIILYDCESTGLPYPKGSTFEVRKAMDPATQPHITEIAAIKIDDAMNEIARIESFVNPCIPIPEETIKINGITNETVKDAPTFPTVLNDLILPFWLGERTVVAYNVEFDNEMLYWELRRIGWEYRFPYCSNVVDAMQYRNGKRISLDKWSEEVQGDFYTKQTHRAMGDVERLLECFKTLVCGEVENAKIVGGK